MTDPIQYIMLDNIRELNADVVSLSADLYSAEIGFLVAVMVFLIASIVLEVLHMRRFEDICYKYDEIPQIIMVISGLLGLVFGFACLGAYGSLDTVTEELEHAMSVYVEVYGPIPEGFL